MKVIYKHKLFLSLAITFTIFTIVILLFEQSRERKLNTNILISKLDTYTDILNKLEKHDLYNTQQKVIPQNIRISIISIDGEIMFDNYTDNISTLHDHASRPEVQLAITNGSGSNIRVSETTDKEYIYYAKKYSNNIIRVAMPYDIQAENFIKGDGFFFNFVVIFFILILFLIARITNSFGKSINELHKFVISSNKDYRRVYNFPDDELGEIAETITNNYMKLRDSKKLINIERDKLLQHIHSSEEGVCFFSNIREVQFYNGLFIQYLNTLTNEPQSEPYAIFHDNIFDAANQFLSDNTEKYFETQVSNHGRIFSLRINIFDDNSFEVVLNDITKKENTKKLKLEITGNIAHELRTPVTGIRGYLETILEQPLSEEQRNNFIKRAYEQTITLSELIRDMGLISKIEDAPQSFQLEKVNLSNVLEALKDDYDTVIAEKNINFNWNISPNVTIVGNKNLIYSIFRNLLDNSIRYAGDNIDIIINIYKEDNNFFYLSFSDNGVGIEDEVHLNRLFERFYRINEGRTRSTGGSGLGLSIVRNAVLFHKGSIIVKNRIEGGLEFLFQIHK